VSFAAIDVGTNSVKMLIGSVTEGRVVPELHRAQITRLGQGLRTAGAISSDAANRTIEALAGFRKLAEERRAERIAAAGTQALREAKNAEEFLARCEGEAGLRVRILTAAEEARLSFQGACWAAQTARVAVVDIGGGSTEIMIGTRAALERWWSLPLGAVVLTEQFLRSDPPTDEEMRLLAAAVERRLREVDIRPGPEVELVGVGGTVAALQALASRKAKIETRPPSAPARLSFDEISAASVDLSVRTAAEREELGLERGRADIIVAGAWILLGVMSRLGALALRAGVHGLRHGMLIEMASGRWV